MPLKQTKNIWFNDKLVPWEEATIHVLTYALHYGAAVFEGIRAYKTDDGCKIFRLDEHIKRLLNSAKIYRMNVPYSHQELKNACQIIVSSNDLNEGAYIRPIAFRGYDDLGLHAHDNDAIDVVVAAWEWGPYLGNASLNDGVDACVSSWNKINPNTIPFMAKASGNYLSATLVSIEARQNGYDEGILLDSKGMVSEGAGENIFMVKDGKHAMNFVVPPMRRQGYLKSHEDGGLPVDPGLEIAANSTSDEARVAGRTLLDRPDRPTAIFAMSDEQAFGVMLSAQDLGIRVPGGLSVVGVDDHDQSELVGLTTVRQDVVELGALAGELLLEALAGGSVRHVEVPTELILRTSTSPPDG